MSSDQTRGENLNDSPVARRTRSLGRGFGRNRIQSQNKDNNSRPPPDVGHHYHALSVTHDSNPPPWQASPAPTTDHVARPTSQRSRTRLQKRPSKYLLKSWASTSAMPQSLAAATPQIQRRSLDQPGLTALPQLPNQTIPQRAFSLRKKTRPQTADPPRTGRDTVKASIPPKSASTVNGAFPARPQTSSAEITPERPSPGGPNASVRSPSPAQRTPRHQPLAPNDPSPLNPLYYIPSPDTLAEIPPPSRTTTMSQPSQITTSRSQQALLPQGFKPGSSAHTDVETIIQPAVTQEAVKQNTVEIVQEEITREIHVHHYYTHLQPIKAIEVLPARHFLVDEQTGQKVEIPAPEGWVMPSPLQPRKPDTTDVGASTRHYLVNEQHPSGIPEPPPNDATESTGHPALREQHPDGDEAPEQPPPPPSSIQKKTSQDLKGPARRTSIASKWTPFPKVR